MPSLGDEMGKIGILRSGLYPSSSSFKTPRKLVKETGGKRNAGRKVWELAYKDVLDLGLKHRMMDEEAQNVQY